MAALLAGCSTHHGYNADADRAEIIGKVPGQIALLPYPNRPERYQGRLRPAEPADLQRRRDGGTMSIRLRIALILLVWLAYGGMQAWMLLHHWAEVGIITAFVGSQLAVSVTCRLITGRWLDYSVLWRR